MTAKIQNFTILDACKLQRFKQKTFEIVTDTLRRVTRCRTLAVTQSKRYK